MERKNVYSSLEKLLIDKKPSLLVGYNKMRIDNRISIEKRDSELVESAFVPEKEIYRASNIIKNVQYLIFQNVIRNWKENVLTSKYITRELCDIQIEPEVLELAPIVKLC